MIKIGLLPKYHFPFDYCSLIAMSNLESYCILCVYLQDVLEMPSDIEKTARLIFEKIVPFKV